MEKINLNEYLAANEYPGRGIAVAKAPDGRQMFIGYFIMGRSENSRNRVFDPVPERGGICTMAADPAKLEDPSLIIYNPVLTLGKTHIVTNGDQTDTIFDEMSRGKSFADALRTRTFEPDEPNYTPRISAVVYADGSYQMSILKSADGNGESVQRYFFDYPQPVAGDGFWTMMVNEGELLEKFNIKIHPVTLAEVKDEMDAVEQNKKDEVIDYLKKETIIEISDEALVKVAALKVAIKSIAKRYNCKAAAVQCWNAMQGVLGIFPCAANALLTDEKFPVACETDIHGAITSIIAQAASIEDNVTFFADWTVPHPTNNNAELLQHCGPWPISLMEEKPRLGAPFAFNHSHPGSLHGKIKEGEMTILRFDGDNGEYSLLMGKAKTIPGPFNQGTYIWIEVDDLKKLEDKLVCGPYVHHCTGIYEDILPQVFEACKYIEGLTPDPYDCDNEVLKALVRGEK